MHDVSALYPVLIILAAAVVSVLLVERLRLTSVLGYLTAGVLIGPHVTGLITEPEQARSLAEMGVVFMMFTIGLELPLGRIKVMRTGIFGLGSAQLIATTAVIALIAFAFGQSVAAALVIGGGLALSSTAIVLQMLTERGELSTRVGRGAFSVLLMQDLAAGPLIVVTIALAQDPDSLFTALGLSAAKVAIALALILVVGSRILRPLFRPVAASGNADIFAALTLLVILGTGAVTELAGLSMAFGAFLAGMLLAETNYRHQVFAVITPFRGLLLGLFFITVGMEIDIALAIDQAEMVIQILVILIISKAAIVAVLARRFGYGWPQAIHIGALLAQGGEFAFVLIGVGMIEGLVDPGIGQVLIVVVILSMMLTPLLAAAGREVAKRVSRGEIAGLSVATEEDDRLSDHVIVAGYGRVGKAIANHLTVEGVKVVAVDSQPERVQEARSAGITAIYGDGSRAEVLDAVSVDRARAIVVAFSDPAATLRLVSLLRYIFPELKIFARAHDDSHAQELLKAGADGVTPEIFDSAIRLAGAAMQATGRSGADKAEADAS